MSNPSQLVRRVALAGMIFVAVASLWTLLFMAVGTLPPEPTPESLEMGPLR